MTTTPSETASISSLLRPPPTVTGNPSSNASSSTTSVAAATTAPPISKPPLSVSPSAYLDSTSYAIGSHPIEISASALIHPRARLISSHCPLIIGEGSIVTERCVVGGPAPQTGPDGKTLTIHPGNLATSTSTTLSSQPEDLGTADRITRIGSFVHLHPSSTIHHGAQISSYTTIDPLATILPNIRVGAHSKICSGVIIDRDVGDWEVVWGGGSNNGGVGAGGGLTQQRRKRVKNEEVELVRLKGLEGERVGTVAVLKAAQAAQMAARRRR